MLDINEHAQKTWKLNYTRIRYEAKDIGPVSASEIENLAGGKIDIFLGCPLCQGFSESGKKDSKDPQNNHVTKFIDIACALKPLAIGMENVTLAALSGQFSEATKRLERAGYSWTAGILNAAQYGSAQARLRLVLVALRGDLKKDPELPAPTHEPQGQ